jgi:hypothetical protein
VRQALVVTLLASAPTLAQQSFFNVPAGTRTSDHHIFLQAQFNLGRAGESNLTAATGLGYGFEAGFNIFHIDLYGGWGLGLAQGTATCCVS